MRWDGGLAAALLRWWARQIFISVSSLHFLSDDYLALLLSRRVLLCAELRMPAGGPGGRAARGALPTKRPSDTARGDNNIAANPPQQQ